MAPARLCLNSRSNGASDERSGMTGVCGSVTLLVMTSARRDTTASCDTLYDYVVVQEQLGGMAKACCDPVVKAQPFGYVLLCTVKETELRV